MPTLHHREPGLIAAALADPRITVGLVADGLHVHPALVGLLWRWLGPDRLNIVTDAMAALGMGPGQYLLGDYRVTVEGDAARPVSYTHLDRCAARWPPCAPTRLWRRRCCRMRRSSSSRPISTPASSARSIWPRPRGCRWRRGGEHGNKKLSPTE